MRSVWLGDGGTAAGASAGQVVGGEIRINRGSGKNVLFSIYLSV